jgi:hypothetical protein
MSGLFGGGGPKAKQPTAALGLDIQTAEYGKCVPVVFGRAKFAGVVNWYGNFQSIQHREKPAGSKGGTPKQTRYTYKASFMVALCEGVASIRTVYNGTVEKTLAGFSGVSFSGQLGQAAWSHLPASQAVGYSGTLVAGFQNHDLGDNPSLPNFAFEVDGLNQLNAAGGVVDADPADIVRTVCTDTRVGIAFGALGDLTSWSNYCRAAGLLFSPVYDTQSAAREVINDLLKYSNTEGWFSEGKLKVKPRGMSTITGNGVTYTPDTTIAAEFGANDFITNGPGPAVKIKRKSPADAMNVVRLEYKDRAKKYRTVPVSATIDDDVVRTGTRAETSQTVDMILRPDVAALVAQNMVERSYYVRNDYEFKVSWRYCYLEPMDIVTLTDPLTGLNGARVLIKDIGEDDDGLITIEAEDLPEGLGHAATYSAQSAEGFGIDAGADPGPVTTPYFFRAPGFLVSPGAPEVWCALAGDNPLWAGCDVYISRDGTSYEFLQTYAREATYGSITDALGVTADPMTTAIRVALNGRMGLLGCSATEADQFVTMSLIGDEVVSYQTAALVSEGTYDLGTRVRRGGYGTAIKSHAAGTKFVRLDENILRIPVDPSQIGTTIYVKFQSFNCFGQGGRTLDQETAYSYVIGTNSDFPDVPPVPATLAVTPVADGVNLSWDNTSPAAVACTSIEYRVPAGTWSVLGQTGPTDTRFHHAFDNGATYEYRARARGYNVAAGWSAYTAILSSTGKNTSQLITNAQDTANQAKNDAAAANLQLSNIASDSVLTPGEKPVAVRERDVIVAEQAGIDAQAASYGIGAERTNYNNAVKALTDYLATLTAPTAWNNFGGNTDIAGATFRQRFADVYTTRQKLLDAIVAKAKSLGDTAQNTANGAALVRDGNFEAGGLGWSNLVAKSAAGFYIDDSGGNSYAGTRCLTHWQNGGAYQDTACERFPIAPGETVIAECMARNYQGGANGDTYLRVWGYGADETFLGVVAEIHFSKAAAISGTEYKRMTAAGRMTDARLAFARIGIAVANRTVGHMLFDAFRATVDRGTSFGAANMIPNGNFGGLNGYLAPWKLTWNSDNVGVNVNPRRSASAAADWVPPNIGVLEVHQPNNVSTGYTEYAPSGAHMPVIGGKRYQGHVKLAVHRCDARMFMRFYDSAGNWLSGTDVHGNTVGTAFGGGRSESSYGLSGVFAVAPSNAASATIVIYRSNTHSGNNDSWMWAIKPFLGPAAEHQTEFSPWVDSSPFNADGLSTGDLFGVMSIDDLWEPRGARRNGLRVPGSGHRFGDERNMRALAGWNKTNGAANVSLSSTDDGTTATIHIPAHSRVAGFGTTSFPSASITGLAFSTYYLVYRDTPNYNPNENAYAATTDSYAGLKHSDRAVIAGITTVADGGSGGGGGGSNDCVAADAWVREGVQARDVRRFMLLDVLRPKRWCWRVLWRLLGRRLPVRWTPRLVEQPGVLVETESGAELPCSHSTPFDLPGGRVAYAPYLLSELVHTDAGVERVVRVTDLGRIPVVRISVYGHSFAAGRHPARRIFSHNATVKP